MGRWAETQTAHGLTVRKCNYGLQTLEFSEKGGQHGLWKSVRVHGETWLKLGFETRHTFPLPRKMSAFTLDDVISVCKRSARAFRKHSLPFEGQWQNTRQRQARQSQEEKCGGWGGAKKEKKGHEEEISVDRTSAGKTGLSPGRVNWQQDREVPLLLRDSQSTLQMPGMSGRLWKLLCLRLNKTADKELNATAMIEWTLSITESFAALENIPARGKAWMAKWTVEKDSWLTSEATPCSLPHLLCSKVR